MQQQSVSVVPVRWRRVCVFVYFWIVNALFVDFSRNYSCSMQSLVERQFLMSLCFLRHLFETSSVICERSPKPKIQFAVACFWTSRLVSLIHCLSCRVCRRHNVIRGTTHWIRPASVPATSPQGSLARWWCPDIRPVSESGRSCCLYSPGEPSPGGWPAGVPPAGARTKTKSVASTYGWRKRSNHFFFLRMTQTDFFFWCGDLLWISFWLPVPSSPVPSAPSSPPPAVFSPSCPVSARPHPFIEGESLVSSQK